MGDKVVGGRGHRISPVGNGKSKIAYSYSPCPKIDSDNSFDNCLSLGVLPTPSGNLKLFSFLPFKIEINKKSFLLNL